MSYLCAYMRDVISEFDSEIEGSLAFCALMFWCSIMCLMCSGISLRVKCILPFGMLCLSVWRMTFVKTVFAVCIYLLLLRPHIKIYYLICIDFI